MHATRETEADTRATRIDPVLREAGWGVAEGAQVHRELICPGRILGGGQRGSSLDVVLEGELERGRVYTKADIRSAFVGIQAHLFR